MSPIFFQNALGEKMALDASMSIEDLVRHGVTSIRFSRKECPLGPGWWGEVKLSGATPKTAATRQLAKKKERK